MITAIDKTPWLIGLIMTIIIDPIWQGVNRIWRHRGDGLEMAVGVLWIFTLGLFGIGWIADIASVFVYKTIKVFA